MPVHFFGSNSIFATAPRQVVNYMQANIDAVNAPVASDNFHLKSALNNNQALVKDLVNAVATLHARQQELAKTTNTSINGIREDLFNRR